MDKGDQKPSAALLGLVNAVPPRAIGMREDHDAAADRGLPRTRLVISSS